MDPCLPGVSLSDARAFARLKLGVPPQYANKMAISQICQASNICHKTNILPPMEHRLFKSKMYLIDPKSPISIKDYILLLGNGNIQDIKKIAQSVKLVTEGVSKKELAAEIIKVLISLNISEPIEVPMKVGSKFKNNPEGTIPEEFLTPPSSLPGEEEEFKTPTGEEPPAGEEPPTGEEEEFKTPYSNTSSSFKTPLKLSTHPSRVHLNSSYSKNNSYMNLLRRQQQQKEPSSFLNSLRRQQSHSKNNSYYMNLLRRQQQQKEPSSSSFLNNLLRRQQQKEPSSSSFLNNLLRRQQQKEPSSSSFLNNLLRRQKQKLNLKARIKAPLNPINNNKNKRNEAAQGAAVIAGQLGNIQKQIGPERKNAGIGPEIAIARVNNVNSTIAKTIGVGTNNNRAKIIQNRLKNIQEQIGGPKK